MVDMKPLAMMMVMALAALALAACGSSGNRSSGKPSDDDKAFDNAVKLAQCMRQHGIQMSDPQRTAGGGIMMKSGRPGSGPEKGGGANDPDSPKFKAADRACRKYEVAPDDAHAPSPQEQAEHNDALIGYARCMRTKGINFPDPRIDGNKVSQRVLGDPNTPKFKAADAACHSILAKFEPRGGGAATAVQP
jgi:hypothetical protein